MRYWTVGDAGPYNRCIDNRRIVWWERRCDIGRSQIAPTKFEVHRNKFSLLYVGANCVRLCKIMRFSVIHGGYLSNNYLQFCEDNIRTKKSEPHKYNKNSVLGSGELSENTTLEKLLCLKFSNYKTSLLSKRTPLVEVLLVLFFQEKNRKIRY